jgi:hypothetical protein
MAADELHPELLFSYGTLQLEAVQMATFGRRLAGTGDVLRGFELVSLKIEDQTVIAISGKAVHTMASFTGRASDVISGTVFAVTPDEIQNADTYEVPAVKRSSSRPSIGRTRVGIRRCSIRAFGIIEAATPP